MDINHSTILHYKHFCVTELWTELTALDVLHFILFTKTTVEMRSGWGSKSGNTMNWFKQTKKKKKINKKKIQRTLEKDVPSISLHKQKKTPLFMHMVHKYLPEILRAHGVLPWCTSTFIVIFELAFLLLSIGAILAEIGGNWELIYGKWKSSTENYALKIQRNPN